MMDRGNNQIMNEQTTHSLHDAYQFVDKKSKGRKEILLPFYSQDQIIDSPLKLLHISL